MKLRTLLVFCILTALAYAAANPFVGTWKLDSRRSKFTIGEPGFISGTVVIESTEKGLRSTASGASDEGLASDYTFTCSLDGVPCEITTVMAIRGSNAVDTITLKLVDSHKIEATGKHKGKLVFTDDRVVSADGNTLTIHRKGTSPEGKKYESTIVMMRTR